MKEENKLAIFQGKQIRKIFHNEEWWFSVIDLINALEISTDARNYWKVLKSRLIQEGSEQTVTNCNQLKLMAVDGKYRKTDCANTEIALRIIQSIPSAKAEPFKLWLAQVGYERVKEIEDPELASQRAKQIYKANLTAEISKATFGVTPSEYKKIKGLKRENLRDHMDDFELIFTMLGEKSTTEIHKTENSYGKEKLKKDASRGGRIAGIARTELEKEIGRKIVSKNNFLPPKKPKNLTNKT